LQPLPPAGQQAVPPAPNPAPKQTQNFAPVAPVIQPLPAKQMSAPAKSMNPTAPADPHHGAAQQFPGAVVQHSAVSPASVMSHTEMVAAPPDATASLWPRGAESSMVAVNRTENSEPLAPPVAVAMNSVDNLLNAIESKTSEPVTLIAPVAQPLRQAPVWVVQVASYGRETEALSYASKLKGKGYDTLVSTTDIAGKTRYRVEVGPLASRDDALALQKNLRTAQRIEDSLVLSKVPAPGGETR